ncbi:hypothetical protein ATCC90586_008854 [Pythium insidiosum]|nr:hypothetical protein ATCC90586_008854 [Pythium insidiosum]
MEVFEWSAKSPDLNPIEKMWGYLTRRLYAEGKQYDSVNKLKVVITREWSYMDPKYLAVYLFDEVTVQHLQANREFKIEGASMPTYHGKPHESVDEFMFKAKLFMSGKNIDYHRAESQARVVSMLAANLREGAASWYHSHIVIDNEPIRDIDEFERPERGTGSVEDYVARFRQIIAQVRDMS